MSKIIDALSALVFLAVSLFGAATAYNFIRYEALKQVKRGLSSTYLFSQRLTGEQFKWEK